MRLGAGFPDMALRTNPIVIVGMHRSGTSLLAAMLSRLGVFFGRERDFFSADSRNETGYFELQEQIAFNRKLFRFFDLAYDRVEPLPDNWREFPGIGALKEGIRDLISKHFDNQQVWGWKEPLTTVLLPIYNEVLSELGLEPLYLICVRDPSHVVQSLNRWQVGAACRREPQLGEVAEGLWTHYTISAFRETIGHHRSAIRFEQLLKNPIESLEYLTRRIPVWNPSDASWQEVRALVRPDLDHGSNADTTQLNSLTRQVDALSIKAATERSLLEGKGLDAEIVDLADSFQDYRRLIGDGRPTRGCVELHWEIDGRRGTCGVELDLRRWQILEFKIPARVRGTILATMYPLPCRLHVRRAEWVAGVDRMPVNLSKGGAVFQGSRKGISSLLVLPETEPFGFHVTGSPGSRLQLEVFVDANQTVSLEALRFALSQRKQG